MEWRPPRRGDATEGPSALSNYTPEELRERLVGIQRRLAKEGVRAAGLECALRDERTHVSELTLELKAAREVPRGRALPHRANFEGEEDAETRLEVARSQYELVYQERLKQTEAGLQEQKEAAVSRVTAKLARAKSREIESIRKFATHEEQLASRFEDLENVTIPRAEERTEKLLSELRSQENYFQGKVSDEQVRCEDEVVGVESRCTFELEEHGACIAAQEKISNELELHVASLRKRNLDDEVSSHNAFLEKLKQQQELLQSEFDGRLNAIEAKLAVGRQELMEEYGFRESMCNSKEIALSEEIAQLHAERNALGQQELELQSQSGHRAHALEEQLHLQHELEQQEATRVLALERQLLVERAEAVEIGEQERSLQQMAREAIVGQLNDANTRAEDSASSIAGLHGELNAQFEQLSEERRQVEELHEINMQLAHAVDKEKAKKGPSEEMKRLAVDNSELRLRLQEQGFKLEQESDTLDQAHQEVAGLQARLSESNHALAEAKHELSNHSAGKDADIIIAQLQNQLKQQTEKVEQLQNELNKFKAARNKTQSREPNTDFAQLDELQQMLRLAHEENSDLRERVAQQAEEISLLEGRVLGALDDIRDDDATGRRWGVGLNSRHLAQRASSVPPAKAGGAGGAAAPKQRNASSPPTKPGNIRRVPRLSGNNLMGVP